MKAEDTTTTTAPATPTTATTVAAAATAKAWSQDSASVPYQHYQPYSSHYPQAAYGHYQYATMQAQLLRPATTAPAAAATPAPVAATSSQPAVDTADISTLNDALGSAGVDLKAEEESLQRGHDQHQPYRPYEDRTRKQAPKPSFDTTHLGTKMRSIGTSHKVSRIPDDSINYLALALRARLQDLITHMIEASHHRTSTQFERPASLYLDGTPMWSIVVRSDVAKQLAALEKVEREEEVKVRRERKERAEMTAAHAAVLAAQANGAAASGAADGGAGVGGVGAGAGGSGSGVSGGGGSSGDGEEGGAKKKRKKDGPGVTARNMSEDVRKKMSNAVATQAAGLGGKYAWMTAATVAPTPAQKPKPPLAPTATTTPTTYTTTTTTTTTTAPSMTTSVVNPTLGATAAATTSTPATASTANSAATTSSWARPYVPTRKPTSATTSAQPTAEEDTRTAVSMRDAIFVVEKERGHGGGRGAARGFI